MKLLAALATAGVATAMVIPPKSSNFRMHEAKDHGAIDNGHFLGQDGAGQRMRFPGVDGSGERKLMPGQDGAGLQKHLVGQDGAGQQKHLVGQDGAGQQKHLFGQDGAGLHKNVTFPSEECFEQVIHDIEDLDTRVQNIDDAITTKSIREVIAGVQEAVADVKEIKNTIAYCQNATVFDNVEFNADSVANLACLMKMSDLVVTTRASVTNGFMASLGQDSMGLQHSMAEIKFALESMLAATTMCSGQSSVKASCLQDFESTVKDIETLQADVQDAIAHMSLPNLLKVYGDLKATKQDMNTAIADCKLSSGQPSFSNAIVGPVKLAAGTCDQSFTEILSLVAEVATSLLAAAEEGDIELVHSIVETRVAALVPTVGTVMSTCQ